MIVEVVRLELLLGVLGAPISLEHTDGGPPSIESSVFASGGSTFTIVDWQLCCNSRKFAISTTEDENEFEREKKLITFHGGRLIPPQLNSDIIIQRSMQSYSGTSKSINLFYIVYLYPSCRRDLKPNEPKKMISELITIIKEESCAKKNHDESLANSKRMYSICHVRAIGIKKNG